MGMYVYITYVKWLQAAKEKGYEYVAGLEVEWYITKMEDPMLTPEASGVLKKVRQHGIGSSAGVGRPLAPFQNVPFTRTYNPRRLCPADVPTKNQLSLGRIVHISYTLSPVPYSTPRTGRTSAGPSWRCRGLSD